ncbi:MAG: translation elongation factor 4, partial [Deltaproteobacteria bacterium]|nr:translation elongation factor 4 [Deltaproteobacteria bacterium]
GVVSLIRIVDGTLKKGMKIRFHATGKIYEVQRIGVFSPAAEELGELKTGEVGFLAAVVKSVHETRIGDTITEEHDTTSAPLPGFKEVNPMVFAGLFPVDSAAYEDFKVALEKLRLNDASFNFTPESSTALGFGFRCGFLGLLHLEIIRERLEREYNLELISTAPMVLFQITTISGELLELDNPAKMPSSQEIAEIREPFVLVHIHTPVTTLGNILKLCEERRGIQKKIDYLSPERILVVYEVPFCEIMFDFFDKLKSLSKGYASLDYEFLDWRPSDLIRLNILVNGDLVDALSIILHKDKAYYRARELVHKLREVIPRQQYEVAIQAAIGAKVIARETVAALRKNVTAKCYGGDISRKRKLLEKQKEGKKRMKQVGNVEIPQEAFLSVLKVD